MSRAWARTAWLPPLLVGAAAAASAEMAVGLLLYARAGVVFALTVVLCVQAGALAVGLWSAPGDTAPPWRGVRRAWLLLVLAHAGGAVLAGAWEVLGGLAGSWLARGLGLALLAALPLYATGQVLGAAALTEGGAGRPGAAAALGAALGFGFLGAVGTRLDVAATAYVAGLVAVAAGALLHGAALVARERDLDQEGAA